MWNNFIDKKTAKQQPDTTLTDNTELPKSVGQRDGHNETRKRLPSTRTPPMPGSGTDSPRDKQRNEVRSGVFQSRRLRFARQKRPHLPFVTSFRPFRILPVSVSIIVSCKTLRGPFDLYYTFNQHHRQRGPRARMILPDPCYRLSCKCFHNVYIWGGHWTTLSTTLKMAASIGDNCNSSFTYMLH